MSASPKRSDSWTIGVVPTARDDSPREQGSDLLTVALEDYFQVAPLSSVVAPGQWYRFERRVERNTLATLDLLERAGARATFFVVGWLGEELPELVREVADRGHEVASKGYYHRSLAQLEAAELYDDAQRSREVLQAACGRPVLGYRIGHGWYAERDLWALRVLASAGVGYDSSVRPQLRGLAGDARFERPHRLSTPRGDIWEFPHCSLRRFGLAWPISGGNYHRQFPGWMVRGAVDRWRRGTTAPFMMYFHVWDLDPSQPRIRAAPLRQRIRQYRNLDKMEERIGDFLNRCRFRSIVDYLEVVDPGFVDPEPAPEVDRRRARGEAPPSGSIRMRLVASEGTGDERPVWPPAQPWESPDRPAGPPSEPLVGASEPVQVTVVVPCYNEETGLSYLRNTLASVRQRLAPRWALSFVFVDDASTDRTWDLLQELFGDSSNCRLIRHERNLGVAGAIHTGIREAATELVASIDADCTYDPHQLAALLGRYREAASSGPVAMVTASPYHPEGRVANVGPLRRLLSRGLSRLYRIVLREELHTYTSCFRVYRREALLDVEPENGGFLGVSEVLGRLVLRGDRVVECPSVLESRLLGASKMRIVNGIRGHLGLLARLVLRRLR